MGAAFTGAARSHGERRWAQRQLAPITLSKHLTEATQGRGFVWARGLAHGSPEQGSRSSEGDECRCPAVDIVGPKSMLWHHPHSGRVFPSQKNLSGNISADAQRCISQEATSNWLITMVSHHRCLPPLTLAVLGTSGKLLLHHCSQKGKVSFLPPGSATELLPLILLVKNIPRGPHFPAPGSTQQCIVHVGQ